MARLDRANRSISKTAHRNPSGTDSGGAAALDVATRSHEERRHAARPRPERRRIVDPRKKDPASAAFTIAYCLAIVWLLAYGYAQSAGWQITSKDGVGYYVGIAGSLMMLALLLYPARKHYRWMRGWGSIPGWFRAHMMLGILGPALVLIHSGFELHSVNGTVAMLSMLAVVASGIVGRYLYSRLHLGLYGRRAEIAELIKDIEKSEASLSSGAGLSPDILQALRENAEASLGATRTMLGVLRFRAGRSERWKLKRELHTEIEASTAVAALRSRSAPSELRTTLDHAHSSLDSYFFTVEEIGSVRLYERLFHLWHILHMPLFFLLIATAVAHVLAVHLY